MRQQAWLHEAYREIRASLVPEAPENVLVSYGFPAGGRGRKRIGECWSRPTPDGIAAVIFIHPRQWTEPGEVLHVLLHEAIHAAHPDAGHRGDFRRTALRVGLTGKMTATVPSEELAGRLNALAEELSPFPAAAFDKGERAKQKTRLRLWTCECGVKVRVASDAFDATCNQCEEVFKQQ